MLDLLWLIPAMPLASFLALALLGRRLPRIGTSILGVGSIGVSAAMSILIAVQFISSPPAGHAYTQVLWTWISVGSLSPQIALYLDPLSLVMVLVVTVVSFFIHLYSVEYMEGDEGFNRFFMYMNLFVAAMLTLVLGDNLLLLYAGWEGVGLCSYLLIGFWYKDPVNGRAARKAFIVTRVGDTAMVVGLFLLFTQLGTLQIQDLMGRASAQWGHGSTLAFVAAVLLLGGACGKSAQLPLQTWLPDAMAGPTPTSALIHAATMVTAGVYLIARTHVLFALSPAAMAIVAIVGAATLLLAGLTALTQADIKRVLAYSTVSQIGYMFLGLGVGAWSAAMFHFMIHAFFKSLLFLGAGAVILAMHHEQDMFRMGGLRKRLPAVFWTFLIGCGSLAAIPLVTGGFYSKDAILSAAWTSEAGHPLLYLAGLLGAFLTSVYTFRMVFLTFFGEPKHGEIAHKARLAILIPLVVLAVLATLGGFLNTPATLGRFEPFSDILRSVFPEVPEGSLATEWTLQIIAMLASLGGVYAAYVYFLRSPQRTESLMARPAVARLHRFWFSGWGFDWLYDRLFVRPILWVARANRDDIIDSFYDALARINWVAHLVLVQTQTGHVRWYAVGIVIGAIIILGIVVL